MKRDGLIVPRAHCTKLTSILTVDEFVIVASITVMPGWGLFSVRYKFTLKTPLSNTRRGGTAEGLIRVKGTSTSARGSRGGVTGAAVRSKPEFRVWAGKRAANEALFLWGDRSYSTTSNKSG